MNQQKDNELQTKQHDEQEPPHVMSAERWERLKVEMAQAGKQKQ
jgi:hypothetical protein